MNGTIEIVKLLLDSGANASKQALIEKTKVFIIGDYDEDPEEYIDSLEG